MCDSYPIRHDQRTLEFCLVLRIVRNSHLPGVTPEDNSGAFDTDIGLPKTLSKVDLVSFIN